MKDPFERIADQEDGRDDGLTWYFGETQQEMAERLGREYSQNGNAEVRNALTATLVKAWNPPPLVEINHSELRAEYLRLARPLMHFADFNKVLALDWIVKGMFARGHNSYTFGPPGCGKSAMLSSVATHLGAAADWHGFKIKQKSATVYFALERGALVQKRIWAECEREGFGTVPIAVAPGMLNVLDPRCVEAIVGTILRAEDDLGVEVGFMGLDTFGKAIAAGGGDENSARDQNVAWGHLRMVHEAMARWHGIHIAAIGHTGKDESRGARGSNAADGDNDVSLQIKNETHTKSVAIYKANELPTGPLLQFRMEPQNTGQVDDDGDPVDIWIVAPDQMGPAAETKKEGGKALQKFRAAFDEAALSVGKQITPRAGMAPVLAVKVDDVRREFYRVYVTGGETEGAKRAAFHRALNMISDREFGACAVAGADWIWRVR
jgi:hypothetical protein